MLSVFNRIAFIVVGILLVLLFFVFETPRYLRLKAEAAAWNKDNWENGVVLRAKLKVTSSKELGAQTATTVVNCYRKAFASTWHFKGGGPGIWTVMFMEGSRFLVVPFHPGATHQTDLAGLCPVLFRLVVERGGPPPAVYSDYSYIVEKSLSFSCPLTSPSTSLGEVTRPRIIEFEKIALREKFDYYSYAFASPPSQSTYISHKAERVALVQTRPAVRQRHGRPVPAPHITAEYLYWNAEDNCWSANHTGVESCKSEAEFVCGRPWGR